MGNTVTVVVGAQFGSEGKGAICGHLGKSMGDQDVAIRVAGPNAGHTVIDPNSGAPWKLRALPVAAVTSDSCQLHIAAGSEIDIDVLCSEINMLDEAGFRVRERLTIHPSATMLTDVHISRETEAGLIGAIGSTGKGIGAARADRIMRRAATARGVPLLEQWLSAPGPPLLEQWLSAPGPFDVYETGNIVIEGTQGYGLGLHTQFYPQVTSSDCRAIDFLSMAGVSPWSNGVRELKVILVARTYPIRVAGNSGPLHGETTWEQLGLKPEHTTVTNKVRRVGQWDSELVREAIEANGGGGYHHNVTLALTMLDHRFPDQAGRTDLDDEPMEFVENLADELETHITLVGTGPDTVVEL